MTKREERGFEGENAYDDVAKTLGCITTTEFNGEGIEGEGLSESRLREKLTHGLMRGNSKNR